MQRINNLLGAAYRKGRDDDPALLFERLANHPGNLVAGMGLGRVVTAAVGAFDLQVIHSLDGGGVPENVVVAAPDIAAEKKPELAPILANIEDHLGRAQDMAGIPELDGDAVADGDRAVIIEGDKLADGSFRIGSGVEGFDRGQSALGSL